MPRLLSIAAAGLLAVGLTACGTSNGPSATGTLTPSPSATAPDAHSCSQAEGFILLAGFGVAGVSTAVLFKTPADVTKSLNGLAKLAAEAKSDVTHPQVKGLITEYEATIEELKKKLDTPGASVDTQKADVDAADAKLEEMEKKLSAICVTPLSGDPCESMAMARLAIIDPIGEVVFAGSDNAKFQAALTKLIAALDAYAAEIAKVGAATSDTELKATTVAAEAEIKKVKAGLATATTLEMVQPLTGDPKFDAIQDNLQSLCK